MVSKCCLCFDLRFGYFTHAILYLGARMSITCYIYLYLPLMFCYAKSDSCVNFVAGFGWFTGWSITAVLFCCLAIVAIVQERSILLYPYIVILVGELLAGTIILLMLSILASSLILIAMLVSICLNGYDLLCCISLYKKFQKAESTNGLISYALQDV